MGTGNLEKDMGEKGLEELVICDSTFGIPIQQPSASRVMWLLIAAPTETR